MNQIIAFENPGSTPLIQPVSPDNPLPVIGTFEPPPPAEGAATELEQQVQTALIEQLLKGGAFTDRSGTITLGGTSQQAAAANTSRRYLIFQNISDTTMWLNFGTAAVATQPSIQIVAGGNYEPLVAPTQAVNVLCATTGKAYACKEI